LVYCAVLFESKKCVPPSTYLLGNFSWSKSLRKVINHNLNAFAKVTKEYTLVKYVLKKVKLYIFGQPSKSDCYSKCQIIQLEINVMK
jgi:hypothetical protein